MVSGGRLGPSWPACRNEKRKSVLYASRRPLLSLLPTLSILRKALDKIAEIKSLLEERRIGELETTRWSDGS